MWVAVLCATILVIALLSKPNNDRESQQTPQPLPQQDSIIVKGVEPKPFDPNTADYRTLTESGVPRDIAVAIIRWREAGKIYRIKEDLALCYQMTDSLYFALEP